MSVRPDAETPVVRPGLDPEAVEVLERGLSERWRRRRRILRVLARPLDTFSSHPIFGLKLELGDGRRLTVIFKQLRPRAERETSREVLIYRRLLPDRRLAAPELYASLFDEDRGRYWLFLEDVGRRRLDWWKIEGWEEAFRWMARMHAAYLDRADELAALGCLADHGPAYYRSLAGAARATLAHRRPGALDRFDELTGRWFEVTVGELGLQTRTLVHGGMTGQNLILQPGVGIRAVDWESARIGVPATDLAKLLAGWGSDKRRLVTAYQDEFRSHAASLDLPALERTLRHCELLRDLRFLYWWKEPCDDAGFVDRLLDEMDRSWRRLAEETGDG